MSKVQHGRVELSRQSFEARGTSMEIGVRLSSELLTPALMQTMGLMHDTCLRNDPVAGAQQAALDVRDLLTGAAVSLNALAVTALGPEAAAQLLQLLLTHTQQHGARHLAEAEAEIAATCHPPTPGIH